MPVEIIDTLKAKNDGYPVVMASDVAMASGERLEDYVKTLKDGGVQPQTMSRPVSTEAINYHTKDIVKTSPVFFASKKKINENPSSEIDFHFFRTANVVYLTVYSMLEQLTNSNKVRAKVPEGYRPIRTVFFEMYPDEGIAETRCVVKIETDGDIFVYHDAVDISDVKLEKRTGGIMYVTLEEL